MIAVKLLNLHIPLSRAGHLHWPVGWPAFDLRLDVEAQPIYRQMMMRLQRDLLLLLMVITISLGILNGAQLGYAVFLTHSGSPAALVFMWRVFCSQ
jgi:hypothetical protein